jgi:acylpyruvate hydrolase
MFKLVSYSVDTPFGSVARLGAILNDDRVLDLRAALWAHLQTKEGDPQAADIAAVRIPDSMLDFVRGGAPALAAAKAAVQFAEEHPDDETIILGEETLQLWFPASSCRLLVPVKPGKMVCAGRNYLKHQAESAMPAPDDFPRGFIKVGSTLVGPGADILYPEATRKLDYEVELAVIIGKPGRDIPPEKAYEHVFGYTIFNDVSARDWQFEERKKGNHLLGKNLDATGPLGPAIVPKEFIPDPMKLDVALRVNGATRQASNTRFMMFDIPTLIAHWSKMTLEPGDMIATGTPEGVASGRKPEDPAFYLKPGDEIEAEVEAIGVLRNRIVAA